VHRPWAAHIRAISLARDTPNQAFERNASMSFSQHDLMQFVSSYGYWGLGGVIALESMGIPLPGETALIAAAVYAGTTHELNIWFVIAAAAGGAILGDNAGYWIGREAGYRLLRRYGPYVGLNESKFKLGLYLFQRRGAEIVFFGRFIAVLRALAALLAGANRMGWPRFLLFNAAGGIVWTALYGTAAYHFGNKLHHLSKEAGLGLSALAVIVIIIGLIYLRRHEAQLQAQADLAIPGPLPADPTPIRRPAGPRLHRPQ
jgi:membrane protein DedA with SNARE-associated domain